MRQKKVRLVVTFTTTTQAMFAEKLCTENGISGRLIPIPTQISAGCGLGWKTETENEEKIKELFSKNGLMAEGYYNVELLERG